MINTLQDICLRCAAENPNWTKARRSLSNLPEAKANELVQLLLSNGRLSRPYQLELFQHSITELSVNKSLTQATIFDQTWIAYIQELRYLRSLCLDTCPRLKDAALAGLWRAAGHLQDLQLLHCSGLTSNCMQYFGRLTQLRSLSLDGCGGLSSPLPVHHLPTTLQQLSLGGISAVDDEACGLVMQHLTNLQTLVLWGTSVTSLGVQLLAFLPSLQHLDISWTPVDALPLLPSLKRLDCQHVTLTSALWAVEDGNVSGSQAVLQLSQLNLLHSKLQQSTDLLRAFGKIAASISELQLDGSKGQSLDLAFLAQCKVLQKLELRGMHNVTSLEPLAGATALQHLTITETDTSRTGLLWLLSLSQLQVLNMTDCKLDNSVLPYVWQLTNLVHLTLDCNPSLTLTSTTSTSQQTLQDEPAQPLPPSDIPQAMHIEDVWSHPQHSQTNDSNDHVQQQLVSDGSAIANQWAAMTSLKHVSLIGTGLKDAGLVNLLQGLEAAVKQDGSGAGGSYQATATDDTGVCQGLNSLCIGSPGITDAGLRALSTAVRHLQTLSLKECSKVTSRGIGYLKRCPALEELNIQGCRLIRVDMVSPLLASSNTLLRASCDGHKLDYFELNAESSKAAAKTMHGKTAKISSRVSNAVLTAANAVENIKRRVLANQPAGSSTIDSSMRSELKCLYYSREQLLALQESAVISRQGIASNIQALLDELGIGVDR